MNPWYSNVDLRILQDFAFGGAQEHNFQVSLDLLNVGNLINSDWGVRKVASLGHLAAPAHAASTRHRRAPVFNFTGPAETFIDDPSIYRGWRAQLGLSYFLQ